MPSQTAPTLAMHLIKFRPNFAAVLLILGFVLGTLMSRCDAFAISTYRYAPQGNSAVRSYFTPPGIAQRRRMQSISIQRESIFMANNDDDNDRDITIPDTDTSDDAPSIWSRMTYIESSRLLLGDLITILLTCQLLGLADAIGVEGLEGFLLPITMPTTMGTLVQRDATISLAWILAALKNESYLVASISTDEALLKSVLETFVDYCILRIGGALALAFAMHQPVDGVELLRQCWFTLLMLGAFRFLYAKNTIIY